ncbi:Ubiquitin carboxyl-terminal hydrolase family protein [Acanthocheilonema viteae]
MGANASSQLEKEIGSDNLLSNEHFYGLVNFGNTCYCNSVIQALYFCRPFREKILQYKQQLKKSYDKESGRDKENLLTCLADLFHNIATQKKRVGTIAPKRFITKLKKENDIFDNFSQQDAHEFLNYLLNTISETLAEEKKAEKMDKILRTNGMTKKGSGVVVSPHEPLAFCQPSGSRSDATWIQEIFQGTLTNETRCLNCETVSSKDEDFLDLSVDVEQNASITHCLRVFSDMETLQGEQKYYCENCCSKHEAQKRMRIKKLPQMLALHLKRFKYVEQMNRHTKLSYRVLFPLELRLFNVSDDAVNRDRLYDLCAVVVHCGSTPNRGHYITLVKSHNFWLLFDDDIVDKIDPVAIEDFFGLSECGVQKNSESAYILFYEARDAVNIDVKGGAGQEFVDFFFSGETSINSLNLYSEWILSTR